MKKGIDKGVMNVIRYISCLLKTTSRAGKMNGKCSQKNQRKKENEKDLKKGLTNEKLSGILVKHQRVTRKTWKRFSELDLEN